MKYLSIIAVLLMTGWVEAGTAQVATQIRQEYERAVRGWEMRLQTAVGEEARRSVVRDRPDPDEFGRRMWTEVKGALRVEWSLDYTPWLLEAAPGVMLDRQGGALKRSPFQEIMREVELMHLKSPKVGRICIAMAAYREPAALTLLEKIEKGNPDKKVKGQAAIAQAILLRHIGEGRDVMIKRRDAVRRAITNAADVKVGAITVGDLAMNEAYIVKHLIPSRVGPSLVGRDISGLPLDLKSFHGKVVVLAFWSVNGHDAQKTIDLLTKLHKKALGRPVELLGVSRNPDSVLRQLKADGVLPWRNFADGDGKLSDAYRVRRAPKVYVLDKKGVIRFIGVPGSFVELAVDDLVTEK